MKTLAGVVLFWAVARFPAHAPGPAAPEPPRFTRFVDRGSWQGALETACVSYEDAQKHEVTLVAMWHRAELPFFRSVQTLLEEYDCVLYEGWTEERGLEGGGKDSPEAGEAYIEPVEELLHRLSVPGLALLAFRHPYQWDTIDSSKRNFVPTDMTWRAFKDSSLAEGEPWLILEGGLVGLREYIRERRRDLLRLSLDDLRGVRAALAEDWRGTLQFIYTREVAFLEGPLNRVEDRWFQGKSVTLHKRNDLVLAALRDQLGAGKRKIAIVYGAAHMLDFERKLTRDLGWKRKGMSWLTVWEVRRKASRA